MGLNIISNIWVADFETTTKNTKYYQENEDVTVVYGYMKNWDNSLDFEFLKISEMIDFFHKQERGAMVYFHNLSFDGDFILKWLALHYKMYNDLPRGRTGFSCLRQGGNIYEITLQLWGNKRRNTFKIKFRCSYRILSSGVEALGKDVGISKFTGEEQEDFYDVEPVDSIDKLPKNYVEYCKRDVEIVRLSLIEFENSMEFLKETWPFLQSFKWNGKLTASSISLKLQKSYVREYSKYIVSGFKHSNEDNELASKFYFGGFTQFNVDYQNEEVKCKRGVCIDINSAHPYSMTKKLPYGDVYDYENENYHDWGFTEEDVLEFWEIHVEVAESKFGGIACLYNWKKEDGTIGKNESKYRYVFSLTDFTCYYMKEEWELMKKYYHFEGVTIKKRYWLFARNFLKGFVDSVYQFKSDFKEKGKKGLSNTFKIILNSGYGIHAKRNDFSEYYVCKDKAEYDKLVEGTHFTFNKIEYVVSGKVSELHELPNQYIRIVERVEKPRANNKFIASAITAYSRIYLLEAILKFNPKNVVYTDTDSIYLKNYKGDLKDILWVDPYELGAWDIEVEYTHFCAKGAKVYYVKDIRRKQNQIIKGKYSGISGKYLKDHLTYETFHDSLIEGGKVQVTRCKSGKLIESKDYKPKPRFH